MVTCYGSTDTLFWQVSVDHNMDSISETKAGCLCQVIIWIIAAMLRDSFVVVPTRPRAIPLAMITMRKSTHGFLFTSHMGMGLRLAALRYYELRQKFNFGMVSNFRSFLSALLSGSLSKSGLLDFGAKTNFPSFFCQWKGFGTYIYKKSTLLSSNLLFSPCYEPKLHFGRTEVADRDQKGKIHRFCKACYVGGEEAGHTAGFSHFRKNCCQIAYPRAKMWGQI